MEKGGEEEGRGDYRKPRVRADASLKFFQAKVTRDSLSLSLFLSVSGARSPPFPREAN